MQEIEHQEGFTIERPLSNPLTTQEIDEYFERGFVLAYKDEKLSFETRINPPEGVARYIFRKKAL